MKKEMDTPAMKELYMILRGFNKQQRFKKAARHLEDALELRSIRHDLDSINQLSFLLSATNNKLIKFCYNLQTHKYWKSWLTALVWVFMALAILEPPHANDPDFFENNEGNFPLLLGLEISCLSFFLLDLVIELYHRDSDYRRSFMVKYIKNKKVLTKFVLVFLFILDFCLFYSSLPHNIFRFSRPLRPFFFAVTNKQMRRTIEGLIRSSKDLFAIVLFFFLICILYGIIGIRMIGDLKPEEPTADDDLNNFRYFGNVLNTMYFLLSRDNYPDVMLPAFNESPFFALYFIPFLIINILLLIPIPIAVMFTAFRNERGKLVIKDRITEKEALFTCFVCMDEDYSMKLEKEEFRALFNQLYGDRLKVEKVDELFDLMDEGKKNFLDLENFSTLVDMIEIK